MSLCGARSHFGDTDLDRDAFVALVRFVEEFDADDRTVLMIQIENNVGLLGLSLDHSARPPPRSSSRSRRRCEALSERGPASRPIPRTCDGPM
jgi:hypothetical protein